MNLADTKKQLLAGLGEHLVGHGFGARPSGQSFHRKTQHGRQSIHLSFMDYGAVMIVTVDVAVRFDAVEALANKAVTLLGAREKKQTSTLGTELGDLHRGEQYRWELPIPAKPAAIEEAVRAIRAKTDEIGLPYLEEFGVPANALAVLRRDDETGRQHCPFHHSRAIRAVALAVVLERGDEVAALTDAKREFLQSRKDPQLRDFEDFVASLPG